MKIKSITDVITNSSTEVFLLETDKTLEEVKNLLPGITEGYEEPEVLTKSGGPLRLVYDFGIYLVDTSKETDVQRYIYGILGMPDYQWEWENEGIPMPEDLKEIRKLWQKYFKDNLEYINKEISSKDKWFHALPTDFPDPHRLLHIWDTEHLPLSFLDAFLKDVWGKPIPEALKIPKELSLGYWEGKIGFSGKEDNSIPYETWEKIQKTFGGTHFHLG